MGLFLKPSVSGRVLLKVQSSLTMLVGVSGCFPLALPAMQHCRHEDHFLPLSLPCWSLHCGLTLQASEQRLLLSTSMPCVPNGKEDQMQISLPLNPWLSIYCLSTSNNCISLPIPTYIWHIFKVTTQSTPFERYIPSCPIIRRIHFLSI